MILDKIENATLYFGLSEKIKKGLEYIQNTDFEKLANGKYYLDGELLIANINQYETKAIEECKLESHQKYIDIQFIIEGSEQVGYLAKTDQKPTVEYKPDKDVMFYEENVTLFPISKGTFCILYPTDLHQPGIINSNKIIVRKLVLKIAV